MTKIETTSALERAARNIAPWLVGLGRREKRTILATSDFILLNFALWLAMSLRLGEFFVVPSLQLLLLLSAAPLIGVATFFYLGLYRLVTRYIGAQASVLIPIAVGVSALFWALLVLLVGNPGVPRSIILLYPIIGAALIWASRQAAGWMLRKGGIEVPQRIRENFTNVLIYGAGAPGVQLLEALRESSNHVAVGFIDQNPTLWGQYVSGLKVHRPQRMAGLIAHHDVKEVLLALPRTQRKARQEALRQLEPLLIPVRTLPAIEDLASGRVTVSDLRPVDAEDLLGREPILPNPDLLARNIAGRSVMVTGAGGTIGSELVRQIMRQAPERLVLFEAAEGALYEIELEVSGMLRAASDGRKPEVVAVLGNVLDRPLLEDTIVKHGVQTIYHAAAYKHVPIVEHNAVAGLRNNTFGTATLADVAASCGVERLVLISTDKAVRPSSIMGASKRLAEMILQARAEDGNSRTVFTMVRFGNVLDSSGSVVRRFRRQIAAGGPVTVTHPDVERYFMSIPEAASLVIQAGAMAAGGDMFVLDMGGLVKINDLAKSMIRLMGREVRDAEHPDGEIAINYIGLRPGEKLREELLIGGNTSPTEHPRIRRSHEPRMKSQDLGRVLEALERAMAHNDLDAIRSVLLLAVEGYRPERVSLSKSEEQTVPEPGEKLISSWT